MTGRRWPRSLLLLENPVYSPGLTGQRGMTLIELLIAMSIFAILSVMVYGSLDNVLNNKAYTEQQADRLSELQQTFTFIQRDIEQIISRPVRDAFGDLQAPFVASAFGSNLIELSRAGLTNPAGFPRSNMQRVAYRYDEKALTRTFYPVLDQPSESNPIERILITDVESVEFRYLRGNDWHSDWPPLGASEMETPKAVELTLEVVGFGKIRRLFRVPPGPVTAGNKS